MARSAGPRHADRLNGRILSVFLICCVLVIPVIAITLVQTTGTPRVIQTTTPVPSPSGTVQTVNTPIPIATATPVPSPVGTVQTVNTATATTTPVPTPVATLQTTQTLMPQATMTTVKMTTAATPGATAPMVPVSTVMTIRQTYTTVMTGSPVIRETTLRTTGLSTGTVRDTAGTPVNVGTTSTTGGIGGTRPTFYGTVPPGTSVGMGSGLSSQGESPELAAAIAGSFSQSRMHQESLQDVFLTSVGTSVASGSGTGAASSEGALYDADVTAVKKGDLQNNCPDDTITIRLRGMDPAGPVAGQIVTGGSQLVFGDPSIRTVEIGNREMKIASIRHVKLFGIVDLQYTEVSTITPDGPTKIDRPFWAGLPGVQPQGVSVAGSNPCAGQAMGRHGSGMTPGVTQTPAPEYHTSEVEITCPCDPVCQPGAYQKCHDDCLSQFSGDYLEFRLGEYCRDRCYTFDLNCCITTCMHNGTDPSRLPEDQYMYKQQGCTAECRDKLAQSILRDVTERSTENVAQVTRV